MKNIEKNDDRNNEQDVNLIWEEVGNELTWFKKWSPEKTKETSLHKPVSISWYSDGVLNACYNCIDRHLPQKAKDVAIIWEADSPGVESKKITYEELHDHVGRMANILKNYGVKKGDRVTIYLPMIPEAAYAILACARIGAVHSVIFAGFTADSIANRLEDCESNFIITADEGNRGGKITPLKENVDQALKILGAKSLVKKVLVIKNTKAPIGWSWETDLWYHEEIMKVNAICPAEKMSAEDPLFLLYTSGSTGKPKGVLHTTGGYLAWVAYTFKKVFDYQPGQIYWCTADVGWVTGHSYLVYGPLANGATSVFFEGVPNYPTVSRFWEVIDKHQVNIFYTAPTALRALMKEGDQHVKKCSRKSLRVLGTVGEPINPEAWNWYHEVVGDGRCPIVDTWWQTETGGILISPTVRTEAGKAVSEPKIQKPGSAMMPLPGIKPVILSNEGKVLEGECEGLLVLADSWPGQLRTLYKDHKRFEETYFSAYPGYYFTGDGCKRDKDGYIWITGRVDDVINVAGHRIGTAEIESAFVAEGSVAEAAVVGFPHDIKGQAIYAYVTLRSGIEPSDDLKVKLTQYIRKHISPIATPEYIQWAPQLPKTRSGKILRRILRKIAENQIDSIGDTSTLADPEVVKDLVENRFRK